MSRPPSTSTFYSQAEYDRVASKNSELMKELKERHQELAAERGKLNDASRKLGAERHKHAQELADLRAEFEGRLSLPRVHVIQEDLDELAVLRTREREHQGSVENITRQADGFRLERDDLQRQCERLTEAGDGMRSLLYDTGELLRRRADEASSHFAGPDSNPSQLSIAPRSTTGAAASEEHPSEQSLFSCDPKDKPMVRLPSSGNVLPQSSETRSLALDLQSLEKPHLEKAWNSAFARGCIVQWP